MEYISKVVLKFCLCLSSDGYCQPNNFQLCWRKRSRDPAVLRDCTPIMSGLRIHHVPGETKNGLAVLIFHAPY